jgi:outer membrane protein assembly factor BamA
VSYALPLALVKVEGKDSLWLPDVRKNQAMCASYRGLTPLLFALAVVLLAGRVLAQRSDPDSADLPSIAPAPTVDLRGKRVDAIEVLFEGDLWREAVQLRRVRVGDPLTPEVARRALRELTDTGRYADARAQVVFEGERAILRLTVVPRRLIAAIRLEGTPLPREEVLAAADLEPGHPVTARSLQRIAASAVALHQRRGYPQAKARANVVDTDDPRRVLLLVVVDAGPPRLVKARQFLVEPARRVRHLPKLLEEYAVDVGDPISEDSLLEADLELTEVLQKAGWHRAEVSLEVQASGQLRVVVHAGPLVVVSFIGNVNF